MLKIIAAFLLFPAVYMKGKEYFARMNGRPQSIPLARSGGRGREGAAVVG